MCLLNRKSNIISPVFARTLLCRDMMYRVDYASTYHIVQPASAPLIRVLDRVRYAVCSDSKSTADYVYLNRIIC